MVANHSSDIFLSKISRYLTVFDTNFLTTLPFRQPFFFFIARGFFFGCPPFKDLLPIKTQRRLVKMSNLFTKGDKSYKTVISLFGVYYFMK